MKLASASDQLPWYRQFWPWFLLAIPLSSVAGGIAMLFLAAKTSDGLVQDDYYRQGLAINRTLARDRLAETLSLSAELTVDLSAQRVRVRFLEGEFGYTQWLFLRLLHPTRANQDAKVWLKLAGLGLYTGYLPGLLSPGHWHLQLEPEDRDWRLTGRLRFPNQQLTRLEPGHTAP